MFKTQQPIATGLDHRQPYFGTGNSMTHSQTTRSATVLSLQPTRSMLGWLCWIVTVLSIALTSSVVFGQAKKDYKDLPVNNAFIIEEIDEDLPAAEQKILRDANRLAKNKIKNNEKAIRDFLTGKAAFSSVSNTFEPFFRQYVFARMTDWKTPGNLSKLGEMREEFIKDYITPAGGSQRQRLIDTVTIPIMKEIVDETADGGYHPAARLNAVILIGMLNQRDGDRSSGAFPIPSQQAGDFLAQVFADAKYEPFLKVGAIAGLKRHAQIERAAKRQGLMSTATKNSLASEALKITTGTAEGQDGWDKGVNYWLQRRSVQCLGLLGNAGNNGQVVDAILGLLKDDKQRYWLRFDGLVALGQLDLRGVDAQKVDGVSIMVIEFVAKSLEAEASKIEQDVKDLLISSVLYNDTNLLRSGTVEKQSRGSDLGSATGGLEGGDDGGGNTGGVGNKSKTPKIELPTYYLNSVRQRVKSIIYTAKTVLEQSTGDYGIASVIDDAEKAELRKIVEHLDTAMEEADIGITNLDLAPEKQEELDAHPESYTQRMANACRTASKTLLTEVNKLKAKAAGGAAGNNQNANQQGNGSGG